MYSRIWMREFSSVRYICKAFDCYKFLYTNVCHNISFLLMLSNHYPIMIKSNEKFGHTFIYHAQWESFRDRWTDSVEHGIFLNALSICSDSVIYSFERLQTSLTRNCITKH